MLSRAGEGTGVVELVPCLDAMREVKGGAYEQGRKGDIFGPLGAILGQ